MTDNGRPAPKLYQDRLYGAKVLSPLAVAIIDTPEFQRLAGLKQLGFADLAYRSAQHTRFEHSLGTYFMARTIMRRIVQNHERLGLDHPGKFVSRRFRHFPSNAEVKEHITTHQSCWRGVMELVSAAALLHDIGHVPFGHTLEDEFPGVYERHDRLIGPRFFEMLFRDEHSHLAQIFSNSINPWVGKIPNDELRHLIYVILSWKERINPPAGFEALLDEALGSSIESEEQKRLQSLAKELSTRHSHFLAEKMFAPFMSDIVGNTICADLLDYLPRDRQNLGMEFRFHTRLQRYFTVKEGSLRPPNEGLRMSIMVTRQSKGGQRKDVATAVLEIMRERYEMAERVYYHHKKAAASAMLVRLVELATENGSPNSKPRDDNDVYSAPWEDNYVIGKKAPHITHLSDSELIAYVGGVTLVRKENQDEAEIERLRRLQKRIYSGLRYDRKGLYRTLLVVDKDLLEDSGRVVESFANDLRAKDGRPSAIGRRTLEKELAEAAGEKDGEIIVYCPSTGMQSKEVDARLEIMEGKVLPLRVQERSFAYQQDLGVLLRYYHDLWRAYIFVSPALFADAIKCKAIVDAFCDRHGVSKALAYKKVRKYDFPLEEGVTTSRMLSVIESYLSDLALKDLPPVRTARLLAEAGADTQLLEMVRAGSDVRPRLDALLTVSIVRNRIQGLKEAGHPTRKQEEEIRRLESYCGELLAGKRPATVAARSRELRLDFDTFERNVIESALGTTQSESE
jgi:HD superfamily phosphohydrolase